MKKKSVISLFLTEGGCVSPPKQSSPYLPLSPTSDTSNEDVQVNTSLIASECFSFSSTLACVLLTGNYASQSSEDAYQITQNFELLIEFFCTLTCIYMKSPNSCLSVRTPRKEITLDTSISVLQQ